MDLRDKGRDSDTNSDEKVTWHNLSFDDSRFSSKVLSLFGHANNCSGLCFEEGCIESHSYRPSPSLQLLTFQKASNHSSSFWLWFFSLCDMIASISESHNSITNLYGLLEIFSSSWNSDKLTLSCQHWSCMSRWSWTVLDALTFFCVPVFTHMPTCISSLW